jgi:hypothetical protein
MDEKYVKSNVNSYAPPTIGYAFPEDLKPKQKTGK